jgi:hypothetical protein
MLPVRLNLNRDRPASTGGLLHLLLARLEEARRGDPPIPVPDVVTTPGFESHLQAAIAALRDRRFSGVCFLLDECEQLVGQDWWKGDASNVLRCLLENRAFATRVGFVLTGFRALRDHRQKVGSRLMHEAAWEYQIRTIKAAAVFVGTNGIGPWQDLEQEAFLREFVGRRCPVIPVILPDCRQAPQLPVLLGGLHWVDFRKAEPAPLEQLIFGITGRRE